MRRVLIIGSTCAGKTTMAKRLAEILGYPRLELDSVFHQADWTPLEGSEFRRRIDDFTSQESWIVDGNYTNHGTKEIIWPRADTVLWLDPSRAIVMRRVVQRSLGRTLTRETLWNGNRERFLNLFRPDAEDNLIVWAWTRHAPKRARYELASKDGTFAHAELHRLRSPDEVDRFLAELSESTSAADTG